MVWLTGGEEMLVLSFLIRWGLFHGAHVSLLKIIWEIGRKVLSVHPDRFSVLTVDVQTSCDMLEQISWSFNIKGIINSYLRRVIRFLCCICTDPVPWHDLISLRTDSVPTPCPHSVPPHCIIIGHTQTSQEFMLRPGTLVLEIMHDSWETKGLWTQTD